MWCLEQGYSSVFCSHTDTWTGFLPPPSPCRLSVLLSPPNSIFPPVFYLLTPNSLSASLPPSPRSSPPICSHFRLHSSIPVSPPHHLLLSSLVAPSFRFHGHQENHSFNSQHNIFVKYICFIPARQEPGCSVTSCFYGAKKPSGQDTDVSQSFWFFFHFFFKLVCPPESPSSLTLK